MKRFIAGVAVGLVLAAAPSWANWDWTDTNILQKIGTVLQVAHNDLVGIRLELQRIANAQDRLVSIQSGATRKDVEKRNQ